MSQTILVALISASSALVGAVFSFIASAFSIRQKIKEIELNHRHSLHEKYLANANLYQDTLYRPLNNYLSELLDKYDYS